MKQPTCSPNEGVVTTVRNSPPDWTRPVILATAAAFIVNYSLQPVLGWDTDLWWLTAGGRLFWEHLSIPRVDVFSHTAFGNPWGARHWGFMALTGAIYNAGGLDGLILLRTVLMCGTAAALYAAARTRGPAPWAAALAAVWAAAIFSQYYHVRPHLISLLCASLCVWILEVSTRGRPRACWWLPVVVLLWANIHGGVSLVALGLIGGYAANDRWLRRREPEIAGQVPWPWLLLLCALAELATPEPMISVAYVINMAFTPNPWRSEIGELNAPNFAAAEFRVSVLFALVCAAGAVVESRRGRWLDLLLLAMFVPLLASAVRQQYLLLPLLAPCVAQSIQGAAAFAAQCVPLPRRIAALCLVGCMGVLALVTVRESVDAARRGWPPSRLVRWESLPEGACQFIVSNQLKGRMFNGLPWGGYLLARLGPDYPVFVDGRVDSVYGADTLHSYQEIFQGGPRAHTLLEQFGVDLVIQRLQFDHTTLFLKILPESRDWRKVFDDGVAAVYLHRRAWPRMAASDSAVPPYWSTVYAQGQAALAAGRNLEAISRFREALVLYPDCTRCRLDLGLALARLGQLEDAVRQWRLALITHHRLFGAHYNLGVAALMEGRRWDAAAEFQAELGLGDSPESRSYLATLPDWPLVGSFQQAWRRFWAPLTVW